MVFGRKIFTIILCFAYWNICKVQLQSMQSIDGINENPDERLIKIIQKPIGKNIRLRCFFENIKGNDLSIQWRYKRCGKILYNDCETKYSLAALVENDWHQVECQEPCSLLNIINLQRNHSGLYQCYTKYKNISSNIEVIQILKVFQLVPTDFSNGLPQIIKSFPNNITAYADQKVILQCKVKSKHAAMVRWIKHKTVSESTAMINEQNYEVYESTETILLNENIYISKFTITKLTMNDKGVYECLATNYFGYADESVYLDVIDKTELSAKNNSTQFFLFIIPVLLLLTPLLIWLCFSYKILCKVNKYKLNKKFNNIRKLKSSINNNLKFEYNQNQLLVI